MTTATPETLDWDCFTFGIIQKPDRFTFYASVNHLHIDGMSQGIIFLDIHLAYQDLIAGRPVTQPEISGYRDYTARQCGRVANMDLLSGDPGLDRLRPGGRRQLAELPAGAGRHLVEQQR